jgi:hypothetical protein
MSDTVERVEAVRQKIYEAYSDLTKILYDETRAGEDSVEIEVSLKSIETHLGTALDYAGVITQRDPDRKRA